MGLLKPAVTTSKIRETVINRYSYEEVQMEAFFGTPWMSTDMSSVAFEKAEVASLGLDDSTGSVTGIL